MRQIKINKYKDNTHYSIHIVDSFGQEHHIGYEHKLDNTVLAKIEQQACDVWANETKCEVDPLSNAIHELHQIDINSGILKNNRDGLD
jgi:hypothetical protein